MNNKTNYELKNIEFKLIQSEQDIKRLEKIKQVLKFKKEEKTFNKCLVLIFAVTVLLWTVISTIDFNFLINLFLIEGTIGLTSHVVNKEFMRGVSNEYPEIDFKRITLKEAKDMLEMEKSNKSSLINEKQKIMESTPNLTNYELRSKVYNSFEQETYNSKPKQKVYHI